MGACCAVKKKADLFHIPPPTNKQPDLSRTADDIHFGKTASSKMANVDYSAIIEGIKAQNSLLVESCITKFKLVDVSELRDTQST
jgi:hypothetical protein